MQTRLDIYYVWNIFVHGYWLILKYFNSYTNMTTILPLKIQKVNTNRSIYALYMYNTAYCLQMKTLDKIVTHRAEKLYDIWEIKR